MSQLLEDLRTALQERYRVDSEIGRGGMATVFLAEDIKHGRRVAIKVLSPELSTSLGAERFLREIQIAARLSHPHILTVFDSGDANGLLYYVMPFVEGESLRDRLKRESQLPIEDAIGIACEVADALAYAHSFGVVHRDIKPENVLLQSGHAVVADFGIARVFSEVGDQKLTATGMSLGTATYMSPEQFSGDQVDGRSDMYSLACMLYEMLVGEVPFTGPNPMVIMARHTMEAVPSIQIVRQTVTDEVEAAIMRALEKVPADRFQTVNQFKEALLGGVGTGTFMRRTRGHTAARPAVQAPPPPPARSARRALFASVIGIGVLATGLVAMKSTWLGWFGGTHRMVSSGSVDSRRIGVLYFADESKNGRLQYLADGLTESLIDRLSQVSTLDVVSSNGVRAFRGKDVSADSVARALKVGSIVRGSVEPSSKGIKVTVRLVDALADVDIAHKSFDRDTADIVTLQGEVAGDVAEFLRERLGQEVRLKERRNQTKSAEAWGLVQRADKRRKDADSLLAAAQLDGGLAALTEADSMLARAEPLDPKWVEPPKLRAAVAYRRARALRDKPLAAAPAIDSGAAHVARALALDLRNADALELRGELTYTRLALHLVPEGPEANRMLDSAESDLRASVEQNPAQAGAWATLSSLLYRKQSPQDAVNAAQRAYAADAYLANARDILYRLFWTSHDTEAFPDAAKWCAEGHRRFPRDPFFVECHLWMLTTKATKPDPDSAWRLYDSLKAVTPARNWPYEGRMGQIIAAGVIARAGLPDSARSVLLRARQGVNREVDPGDELLGREAIVRVMLHDYDEAVRLLESYLTLHPEHRKGFATNTSLWWRDPQLQENRKFKALIAGAR